MDSAIDETTRIVADAVHPANSVDECASVCYEKYNCTRAAFVPRKEGGAPSVCFLNLGAGHFACDVSLPTFHSYPEMKKRVLINCVTCDA